MGLNMSNTLPSPAAAAAAVAAVDAVASFPGLFPSPYRALRAHANHIRNGGSL